MIYKLLADLVVILHFLFVLLVVFGGFLVLRWRRFAFAHIPAVLWAVYIEFSGRLCSLTPLENWLRERSGSTAYKSGFVEHYILPVLYPEVLSQQMQIFLGVFVLIVNLGIYGWVISRNKRK